MCEGLRIVSHCRPSGRRDLGRPNQRWRDEVGQEEQP
jgi:hypothetical protein